MENENVALFCDVSTGELLLEEWADEGHWRDDLPVVVKGTLIRAIEWASAETDRRILVGLLTGHVMPVGTLSWMTNLGVDLVGDTASIALELESALARLQSACQAAFRGNSRECLDDPGLMGLEFALRLYRRLFDVMDRSAFAEWLAQMGTVHGIEPERQADVVREASPSEGRGSDAA